MYSAEKIWGNRFEVDISVGIPSHQEVKQLDDTIDYERLLAIVQTAFQQKVDLLETLVFHIEKDTLSAFPAICAFRCCIRKVNPPLGTRVNNSEICLEKKYL